ncbi:MAG: TraR/DksA family transcriptional regulator [candidate division Zixibacteria bacterium]|nr:TraR/DksA family transcriptional regulator [candidate division Zixibacteria bacterium]
MGEAVNKRDLKKFAALPPAKHFASKSGRFLYHLDEALRRIADGSYGKCVTCGQDISVARLEAVPHARLCIACKEKEEQDKVRANNDH